MTRVVVPPAWVADHLGNIKVVDVRDAWEFDDIGHIPTAENIPFDTFRSDTDGEAGMLPGADTFATLCTDAGLTQTDTIVAYDDTHGVFAARFLVTAELYGHDPTRLHLLDGDYSAWSREYEITTDIPNPDPGNYDATFQRDGPLVDRATVEAAINDDTTVLVDTREAWEFEEGHIPGAVRLDWRDLVNDETRGLKPPETLQAILHDHGIVKDKTILLYCNTARRISHTYTVLRHLTYPALAFYEGSLTEWERHNGSLETGT